MMDDDPKVVEFRKFMEKRGLIVDNDDELSPVGKLFLSQASDEPRLMNWFLFHRLKDPYSLFIQMVLAGLPRENSWYLACYDQERLSTALNRMKIILDGLNRPTALLNAEGKTFVALIRESIDPYVADNNQAFLALKSHLLNSALVLGIYKWSKSTTNLSQAGLAHSMMKILIDSPHDNPPESKLFFIDTPGFLERHWIDLGPYTNIFTA